MGRLDNAMRRAAEERAAKERAASALDAAVPLADELPSEEPAPAAIKAGHDRAVAVEPDASASVRLPAEPRTSSLLAEVDGRMATKTVIDDDMMPAAREQYRKLAAALHQSQRANGYKVVMVASASAGEGKTLTAANLALTLSESYRRNVLLIDGDMRRPSMHTIFQVPGAPGLSEGLVSREETTLPLRRLGPRLTLLPAGRPTSDPIKGLASDRARRLIEEAREIFDWIIIDTPPIGLLTDASLLTALADGVVLIVKANSTPHDLVNRAVDALGRDRLLGVVLNRALEHGHRSSYDYYKYYDAGTSAPAVAGKGLLQ